MKPLEQVTLKDIDDLIRNLRFKENEKIEYKSALPGNGMKQDPWLNGENKIGTKAVEKLTAEVTAFANTYGGILIIGIQESNEKPPRPKSLNPLPRCHELEQRLMQSITDSIEPPLTSIKGHVIETDTQSNGIILFEIDRSDNAPHRSTKDGQCYFRVQDRCKKMSMIEIQTMAIKRSRQKIEGLWTAKFGIAEQYINAGVVVLEKGKLYGGDSQYLYTGVFEVLNEEDVVSNIMVEHYHGQVHTAFNTSENRFTVSMFAKLQGNVVQGLLYKNSPPQSEIQIMLQRHKELL